MTVFLQFFKYFKYAKSVQKDLQKGLLNLTLSKKIAITFKMELNFKIRLATTILVPLASKMTDLQVQIL